MYLNIIAIDHILGNGVSSES